MGDKLYKWFVEVYPPPALYPCYGAVVTYSKSDQWYTDKKQCLDTIKKEKVEKPSVFGGPYVRIEIWDLTNNRLSQKYIPYY